MSERRTVPCYIIAGGAGRRFGGDKRLLAIDGEPLLARVARVAEQACGSEPVFVGEPPDDQTLARRRWLPDAAAECGPLAGLVSALRDCPHERALVLATDLPLLAAPDLRALLNALDCEDAACLGRPGRPEPLAAVYATRTLPVWERRLAARELALRDGLAELRVRVIVPVSGERALFNLNRAEDERRLRRWLGGK